MELSCIKFIFLTIKFCIFLKALQLVNFVVFGAVYYPPASQSYFFEDLAWNGVKYIYILWLYTYINIYINHIYTMLLGDFAIFLLLTVGGQQHSFLTHEAVFLYKCQVFETENVSTWLEPLPWLYIYIHIYTYIYILIETSKPTAWIISWKLIRR